MDKLQELQKLSKTFIEKFNEFNKEFKDDNSKLQLLRLLEGIIINCNKRDFAYFEWIDKWQVDKDFIEWLYESDWQFMSSEDIMAATEAMNEEEGV